MESEVVFAKVDLGRNKHINWMYHNHKGILLPKMPKIRKLCKDIYLVKWSD